MKVIGLTGNIACGKSSVSEMLREFGAYIIDADIVAREVTDKGREAWHKIKEHFGPHYIGEDGELDRKRLGDTVFSDSNKLDELNSIIHPIIIDTIDKEIDEIGKKGLYDVVVLDAALLMETGCYEIVDEIWLVTLPYEIQVDRLIKRDGLQREEADLRIESQMQQDLKMKYADKIIDNSKDLEYTKEQVEKLWTDLMGKDN